MKYNTIYLIGQGRVAKECLKLAEKYYSMKVEYIDLKPVKELDLFFSKLENCLIISANNFYLFKSDCVEKNTIINYHNALLPKHKGCNAHIWAIWEQDQKTGITWHKVNNKIDEGEIIYQEEISLDNSLTSLQLLMIQHKVAIDSFHTCLENLENELFIPQNQDNSTYHYKKSLPNDGFLDLEWSREKITRFLRAMNSGALADIPKPKIKLFSKEHEILFYEINEEKLQLTLDTLSVEIINKN